MNQFPPAPVGQIEAEIVAASIGNVPWKASDDNPKGECLRLRLSVGREYGLVFADVPLDWSRMLENVRAAAGVSSDLVPEEYTGSRVRVVLKHYTAKDGTTRATVARWLPAPAWPEGMAVPQSPTLVDCVKAWEVAGEQQMPVGKQASKPSRNALPRHVADDDIPF